MHELSIEFAFFFQEPFDNIDDNLLEGLSEDQRHQLDVVLHRFDVDWLLGTLYEFIETYIRHIDTSKKEWE